LQEKEKATVKQETKVDKGDKQSKTGAKADGSKTGQKRKLETDDQSESGKQ
jgi:hypothetical protein